MSSKWPQRRSTMIKYDTLYNKYIYMHALLLITDVLQGNAEV